MKKKRLVCVYNGGGGDFKTWHGWVEDRVAKRCSLVDWLVDLVHNYNDTVHLSRKRDI